jgi:hypothetical protein
MLSLAIIEDQLLEKTLIIKYGLADMASGDFALSKIKAPDLVYYNHPRLLHENEFKQFAAEY